MAFDVTTNFKDSNNVDLGKKLVTKDYLLTVYPSLIESGLITTTGGLWNWGSNDYGELGVNDRVFRSTPVTTILGGNNWKMFSTGDECCAAIKTDGTLWIWGRNLYGQLGVNDTVTRSTPVTTILGGNNWKTVALGTQGHIAAIKTDGTMWCWGRNAYGQVGDNTSVTKSTPVTTRAGGNNWKSVGCGLYTTLALKDDGTLWGWGENITGQIGTGDTVDRFTPMTTILGGNNWKFLSVGNEHTGCVKSDGTLWMWGTNNTPYGVIGNNTIVQALSPVTTLLGGIDWKSVRCTGSQTYAIKTNGTLWSWGENLSGELGVNDNITRSTPVQVFGNATNWKSITGSGAIKTDGTLWTWGGNNTGNLGVNDRVSRSTPVTTILGGTNWKSRNIISVDYI